MAIKVGTLQVDLIANTASFESKLGKAPGTARTSAKGIQDAFNGMDFGEARGGIMVLGEEIGIHLPRHVQGFIATLPGVGAAMNAAFPALAIIAIGVAIFEAAGKLAKLGEEAKKIALDQTGFGTAISGAFNSLDQKLLQAGIKADELSHNHLAELKKRLELINMQSMSELTHSFDVISKAADKVFADLKSHWYSFGIGSEGAKNALVAFQTQYDSLLAQGKNTAASDLLAGTLQSAEHILDLQKQGIALEKDPASQKLGGLALQNKFKEQSIELSKAGVGLAENEIKSQQALVDTLKAQVVVQGKVTQEAAFESTVARQKDVGEENEAQIKKMVILKKAIDESQALIEKRTEFALKGIEKENAATIKAADAAIAYSARYEAGELRISALSAEINDQEAIHTQRMAVATGHMTEQKAVQEALSTLEANKKSEIAKINDLTAEQLALAVRLQAATNGGTSGTDDQNVQYQKAVEAYQQLEEKKLQLTKTFNAQIAAEQLKAANTERSQWNKMALDFAQIQTNMSVAARQTLGQMNSSIASFVTTGTGNFRQLAISSTEEIVKIGLQWVESKLLMLATGKVAGAQEIMTQAAIAGAGGTASMAAAPFPLDMTAPAFGASMMGNALSYLGMLSAAGGALLPNRETLVHAHPEEMILPRNISNFIVSAASTSSGRGGGDQNHFVFAPTIHAVDAEGVDRMLTKHADTFHRHITRQLRRLNF